MKKIILMLVLILLGSTYVYAATIWVSPTGNDTTGNGSSGNPYATPQKGHDISSCGDTIMVKDGVYTDTDSDTYVVDITKTICTQGAPLTFQSENQYGAKIDGQNTALRGFSLTSNVNWIVIDGFEIYDIVDTGVKVYGSNNVVKNSRIYQIGENCIFNDVNHTNISILNNEFHHCGNIGDTGHAVYVESDGAIVTGNLFHNNNRYAIHCYRSDPGSCDNGTFAYNEIYAFGESSTSTGSGITCDGPGSAIYNNIIHSTSSNGPSSEIGIHIRPACDGAVVSQNTVTGVPIGLFIDVDATGTVIRNNIIYDNTTNVSDLGSSPTFSNNLCNAVSGICTESGNPNFVNSGTDDYHLQSSSTSAIDKGSDLSGVVDDDFDRVSRPQGSAYDIGAYEFVQGDTTAPVVTITAPTSNTTYATATNPITTISGTATDAVGTASIAWANAATSGSGAGSGCAGETSCNWSVSSIALNEGSNAITITGTDAASNDGTDTITVTLDTTPPTRNTGAPTGTLDAGTTSTSISLNTTETATCKYGTSAGVAYGSQPNTFSSTNSTSHSTTVSSLLDGNGYTYYVRCQDALSNTNTDDFSISFSVDDASVVTLNPPSSLNTTHASTVTVLGQPSTLSTTHSSTITALGQPSTLSTTHSGTVTVLGSPTGLSTP